MYGAWGYAMNRLSRYLSDRKQYIVLNKFKSTDNIIKCGVPKGSIIGPLLFIIHNDYDRHSTFSLFIYAHRH